MCIIVDANTACEMVGTPSADAVPIIEWLNAKKGKIALGGTKLTKELLKTPFRKLLVQLERAGSVNQYKHSVVDAEEKAVREMNLCQSDDEHILALVRISGCRLVFTKDEALHQDIKNRQIVPKPKGKVYCDHQHHIPLLKKCPECKPCQ